MIILAEHILITHDYKMIKDGEDISLFSVLTGKHLYSDTSSGLDCVINDCTKWTRSIHVISFNQLLHRNIKINVAYDVIFDSYN
jgi:hypothetical protein